MLLEALDLSLRTINPVFVHKTRQVIFPFSSCNSYCLRNQPQRMTRPRTSFITAFQIIAISHMDPNIGTTISLATIASAGDCRALKKTEPIFVYAYAHPLL